MSEARLGIVLSHPIQYYAPLFKVLARELSLKVFYCHKPSSAELGKDGFGKSFQWDIDLLSGYEYEFAENVAKKPSVSEYSGCDCPSIGERLKENKITHVVVFGWYLKALKQTLKYCNQNHIPIACRGDSQLNPNQIWYKRWLKKLYYPFFLNRYDAFLHVGERNRRYLKSYGVSDYKLIFSPHAVDQVFWKVEKVNHEGFVFIWVAKFIEKKRPLDVIRAFKMIKYEDVKLRMIGSGKLLEESKAEAKSDPRIEFPGFKNQTELKTEYAAADALILSSNYEETWGLVVNEAFAVGLPAIVSNACGCSEDMVKGQSGMTYPLGDLKMLRNRIHELKLLRSEKDQKIKESITKINSKYSYEANIPAFMNFIEAY